MSIALQLAGSGSSASGYALVQDPRDRIDGFGHLERDWDTYGAEPITENARAQAKALLSRAAEHDLMTPYAVAPIPNGGVFLEWRGPDYVAEVEVDKLGQFDLFIQIANGPAVEESSAEVDDILSYLQKVLKKDSVIRA